MNTVVLGLGNILLRDEGVGVRVVERLSRRYTLPAEVTVIDGGTAGMELLYQLVGCKRLIVCDAVNADAPPASTLYFTGEQVPAFFQRRLSPHQVGLADVLATLRLTDAAPDHVSPIGVVPEDLRLGTELSPAVLAVADRAVERVAAELRAAGFKLGPLPQPVSLPVTDQACASPSPAA